MGKVNQSSENQNEAVKEQEQGSVASAETQQAPKQRKGMGIRKDTRGASALKFKPSMDVNDGLCLGYLKEITIGKAEYKDNQKGDYAEFAGKSVPTLNFVFEGMPEGKGHNAPVYIHSFKPMPIVPGKYGWFYDSMFQTLKHFIDVYTLDNFLDAYEDLLCLEVDPETPMEFEELVAAYDSFFQGVVTVFNGNGADLPCIYRNGKGEGILVWMKLLLYYNGKEVNNGSYGFSGYPGEGLIELYVPDAKPSLRIIIEKGESIIPKAKTSNAPAAPAPTSAGVPTPGAPAASGGNTSAMPAWMQGK